MCSRFGIILKYRHIWENTLNNDLRLTSFSSLHPVLRIRKPNPAPTSRFGLQILPHSSFSSKMTGEQLHSSWNDIICSPWGVERDQSILIRNILWVSVTKYPFHVFVFKWNKWKALWCPIFFLYFFSLIRCFRGWGTQSNSTHCIKLQRTVHLQLWSVTDSILLHLICFFIAVSIQINYI